LPTAQAQLNKNPTQKPVSSKENQANSQISKILPSAPVQSDKNLIQRTASLKVNQASSQISKTFSIAPAQLNKNPTQTSTSSKENHATSQILASARVVSNKARTPPLPSTLPSSSKSPSPAQPPLQTPSTSKPPSPSQPMKNTNTNETDNNHIYSNLVMDQNEPYYTPPLMPSSFQVKLTSNEISKFFVLKI